MYLRVIVEVPSKLTRDQRKRLEEAAGMFDIKQFEKSKKFADNVNALYGKDPYEK